jgi:hypothetical protein
MRKISRMVVTLGVAAALAAAPAAADIVKCQAGIEKNGGKFNAAFLKALQKCKDAYRKATVTSTVPAAAATCQAGLGKVIDTGNIVSAISKTKVALDSLVTKLTCTDGDLQNLGHLPTKLADGSAAFGNRWSSLVILEAMKNAYELQSSLVGDFATLLAELGKTGSCALCKDLVEKPPCVTNACRVDGSSAEVKVGPTMVTVPLNGFTITGGCQWQNLLTNEIGFVGAVNTALKPTNVFGSEICNFNFRTEGIYSCSGSTAPRIDYSTCQDSVKSDGNECVIGPTTTCNPDPATDPSVPKPASGSCATFTTGPSAQGNVFVLSTTRLRTSSNAGGDGVFCTDDDTYNATPPAQIPITTGTVSAELRDYNDGDGITVTEGPITGTAGPSCATVRGGSSAGLALAGAFPSADTLGAATNPLGDTVTKLTLTCQP